MTNQCNADLDHPCDANNGAPCRYGQHEMRNRVTRAQYESDVRDAYSDPAERHKRDALLEAL